MDQSTKPIVTKDLIAQIFIRGDGKVEFSSHLMKTDPLKLAYALCQALGAVIKVTPKAEQSGIIMPDITMSFENGKGN